MDEKTEWMKDVIKWSEKEGILAGTRELVDSLDYYLGYILDKNNGFSLEQDGIEAINDTLKNISVIKSSILGLELDGVRAVRSQSPSNMFINIPVSLVKTETDKAVLFDFMLDKERFLWMPKSRMKLVGDMWSHEVAKDGKYELFNNVKENGRFVKGSSLFISGNDLKNIVDQIVSNNRVTDVSEANASFSYMVIGNVAFGSPVFDDLSLEEAVNKYNSLASNSKAGLGVVFNGSVYESRLVNDGILRKDTVDRIRSSVGNDEANKIMSYLKDNIIGLSENSVDNDSLENTEELAIVTNV